ncbi:MAG: hypothetical protein ACO3L0_10285, partial [Vulcanococcus sp.]
MRRTTAVLSNRAHDAAEIALDQFEKIKSLIAQALTDQSFSKLSAIRKALAITVSPMPTAGQLGKTLAS